MHTDEATFHLQCLCLILKTPREFWQNLILVSIMKFFVCNNIYCIHLSTRIIILASKSTPINLPLVLKTVTWQQVLWYLINFYLLLTFLSAVNIERNKRKVRSDPEIFNYVWYSTHASAKNWTSSPMKYLNRK
jgi:hypothetical protein